MQRLASKASRARKPLVLAPVGGIYTIDPELVVLGARLKLNLPPRILKQSVTHPSAKGNSAILHNSRLNFLGKGALGCFVAEHFHMKYPNLPAVAFDKLLVAYVSAAGLAHFGREVGLPPLVHWNSKSTNYDYMVTPEIAVASAVSSFIGAIYDLHGSAAARGFVHSYILSRHIDIRSMIEFRNPKRYLAVLLKRQGKQPPESRLLKETGRFSNLSLFLVGTFSGNEKISEGYGNSLMMAEQRSSFNALLDHYTKEVKGFGLPSDVDEGKPYVPTKLGDTQPIA